MPNTESLRPRTTAGKAVTNIRSKTNWSNWSTGTSADSSPIDTPDCSSISSLSSINEDEEHSNIIQFPELEVPELDIELAAFKPKAKLQHAKTDPFTSTAAAPDYNLDKFFALSQMKATMPTETPQIFHDNGQASENPANFLKLFNRAMHQQTITQLNDKLEAYGDYLRTGSQAETWFKVLTSSDKVTWAAFIAAFEKRWPPVIIAEKTKAEYEKELLEYILASEEVGKKMMLYDRECWMHVAWAAKTLQFATNAGIEQGTSMIWQVHNKLPDVVKDLLKDEEYKTWTEFTKQ
jgi:hypothetical protein